MNNYTKSIFHMIREPLSFLRNISLVFALLFILFACTKDDDKLDGITVDHVEANSAFLYLNDIRQAPDDYSEEIGVDLSYVDPIHPLVWNDILGKVAEEKAIDMAKRNYFAHVDPDGNGINILIHEAGYTLPSSWISDPGKNNFESLSAGRLDGVSAIQSLIRSVQGHREHLLGIHPFWSNCYDIGIGFVYSEVSDYPSYCVVIIAKQSF